ncbi:MAG: hypothetical protein AAF492_25725 [Verrucomicrobiota bacterium]
MLKWEDAYPHPQWTGEIETDKREIYVMDNPRNVPEHIFRKAILLDQ